MAKLPAAPVRPSIRGTRVVIDLRPLQEPERAPISEEYLRHLLEGFAARPLAGESFVTISRVMRPDPTLDLERRGLVVHARRRLPPTSRAFRSAGLTLDSFLLRGAELGTAVEPDDRVAGAVYHTAGGAVPLGSRLPVVATLLDLAPWELPDVYAASPAARFGHRLRARVLHDAAQVIVCSRATAESARRLLHLPSERIAVVPLAVAERYRAAGSLEGAAALRRRLGLPERYLAFSGHYDARKDMRTLLRALRSLRQREPDLPPAASVTERQTADEVRLVMALHEASEADSEALRRSIMRSGLADVVHVLRDLPGEDEAALVGGALAFVYPALSEATGVRVLEALSLGVPVVCSRAGALPESVGNAGIVVEPRDTARLASAIGVLWAGGSLSQQQRRAARARAESWSRTWRDVADETRHVYAAAAKGRLV